MSIRQILRGVDSGLLRSALLPFKVYVATAFMVPILVSFALHLSSASDGAWSTKIAVAVVYGYFASIAALLVGALVAVLHTHDKRTMWSALAYVSVGFLLAGFIWAAAFPSYTK